MCLSEGMRSGGSIRIGMNEGGSGGRTEDMAELRVGFGPVVLAPKRRFIVVEYSRGAGNGKRLINLMSCLIA